MMSGSPSSQPVSASRLRRTVGRADVLLLPLFTELPRKTVRKVSDASTRWPYRPSKRCFCPFWPSYTGQIYGRSVAHTPFRTVSEEMFSDSGMPAYKILGNRASEDADSRKPG